MNVLGRPLMNNTQRPHKRLLDTAVRRLRSISPPFDRNCVHVPILAFATKCPQLEMPSHLNEHMYVGTQWALLIAGI